MEMVERRKGSCKVGKRKIGSANYPNRVRVWIVTVGGVESNGRLSVCTGRDVCVCMEGSKTIGIIPSLHHRSISYPREGYIMPVRHLPHLAQQYACRTPMHPICRRCPRLHLDRSRSIPIHIVALGRFRSVSGKYHSPRPADVFSSFSLSLVSFKFFCFYESSRCVFVLYFAFVVVVLGIRWS
jgi:hypothetical protein